MLVDSIVENTREDTQEIRPILYTYEGKIWHVPKKITLPVNAKILTG